MNETDFFPLKMKREVKSLCLCIFLRLNTSGANSLCVCFNYIRIELSEVKAWNDAIFVERKIFTC